MRVRKMNQVDVKLHDLTKVKLKNYRLNWEETGNPVPRMHIPQKQSTRSA